MADVRHLEKYPLRLNLVRGESVAHVAEQALERKTTQMRKQTVNMKKSVLGDVIVAQASGVNMIVEEQKKRNESQGSKKSQFSIQQDSSEGSNEEVNRVNLPKAAQKNDMDF